jgi:uncharacterized protein YbjT (DUF2867 family)
MAAPIKVLITGATGTQGGATVANLLSLPSLPPFHIFALTRNPSSTAAKSLGSDPRVTVVQGDPTSAEAIFAQTGPIDAVFLVTVHGKAGYEESQARSLIDASLSNGVKHFVFSSADRGGAAISDTNPTPVAHIATKYTIELMLKEKTAGTGMSWTILRPTTFMDNLKPDIEGKGFASMWRLVGQKPVQLVAAEDIGYFAARALMDKEKYAGKAIGIAGDELNFEEAQRVFMKEMGTELPAAPCVFGKVLKLAMPDIGSMFKWFEKEGYAVDIGKCREEYPALKDFATWLREDSGFSRTED